MASTVHQNCATPLADNTGGTRQDGSTETGSSPSPSRGHATALAAKDFPVENTSKRNASLKPIGAPSIVPRQTQVGTDSSPIATVAMSATASSPASSGPSSSLYNVPPRPKPGRKPALDKPSEKRKAQNRDAQRAFRERKVAHTEELKKDITGLRDAFNEVVSENGALKRKLQDVELSLKSAEEQIRERDRLVLQLQDEVRRYHEQEKEYTSIKRLHEEMQQKMERHEGSMRSSTNSLALSSFQPHSPITPPHQSPAHDASCGNCVQTGYCKCVDDFTVEPSTETPSASVSFPAKPDPKGKQDRWIDLEQDFTTKLVARNPVAREPAAQTIAKTSHKSDCGLCDDSTACICNPHSSPKRVLRSKAAPNPMDISSIVEPGTCTKCQTNPEQRRFCIEMSKGRHLSDEPHTSAAKRPRLEDGRPRTLTCDELYQASKHVVTESRKSGKSKPPEIESIFNTFARTELGPAAGLDPGEARPGMRYRTFSTSEIDGAEALTALQHSRMT